MDNALHSEGLGDVTYDDEVHFANVQTPISQEEFEYYYGEDVLDIYHMIQNECARVGLTVFLSLSYQDMLELAYKTSPKEKPVS